MKITHHLGRFTTFFKESSLVIQLAIVLSAIVIIAGTATVAAMVVTPNSGEVSTNNTNSESSDVASDSGNQPTPSNEDEQTVDTETATATPQASQTTPQNDTQTTTTPSSSNNSQQDTQPQVPVQPTYTDTYIYKSQCPANTSIDNWGVQQMLQLKLYGVEGSREIWHSTLQLGKPYPVASKSR